MRRISSAAATFALAAVVLSLPASARQEYTRDFDRTLNVQPGGTVRVEHKLGDVSVHTHTTQTVEIHAQIRVSANDMTQAKEFANRVEILIEPAAGVSIRTRYPEMPRSFFGVRNVSYSVHYELTIPENSPLSIRNAFGRVEASGLKAGAEIVNSNGNVSFRDSRGMVRLQNSFGRIEAANNQGDLTIETNNGNVDVSDIGGRLLVRDRFGNVTVARVAKGVAVNNSNGRVELTDSSGSGEVKNSFGNVAVRNYRGDLIVNTTNAAVEAEHIGGAAELNTTFGSVRFSDIGQRLSVRANNSQVEGSFVRGPLSIINSFGPVTVRDIHGDVRVDSGNGSVTLEKIGGNADIHTSFGAVQANDVAGDFTVHNANGSVRAMRVKGATVTTNFGAVILDDATGAIQVQNQNGAVNVASSSRGGCQPISVLTSFATIRVHLPSDASYRVGARTSFGNIRTDFPLSIAGSLSSDHLDGVLGGGRCEMKLTNSNGAIEILKGGSAGS